MILQNNNVLLTGDLASGSFEISNLTYNLSSLPATGNLVSGMNIYGYNLPVDTKISSIDDNTTITLTKTARGTATNRLLEFVFCPVGVYHERNCALIDAKDIIDQYGQMVKVYWRTEDNVSRDDYKGLKRRKTEDDSSGNPTIYYWKAYPIIDSPDRDTLNANGLRTEADLVATFAIKDLITAGFNLYEIDKIRPTVIINQQEYEIREVGQVNQFANLYLNWTMGLFKK